MTDWFGLLDGMTATVRDTFGEPVPVSYRRPSTGFTKDITAIFDYGHEALEAGGGVSATSKIPVLDVRDADLGFPPAADDEVTIAGFGSFRVIDKYPSSAKTTLLHLRKK